MNHEDLMNILHGAKAGVLSGATVITAGSKEELLEKVAEAINANEQDQEAERLTKVAAAIDAEKAAMFAAAALLAAAREFEQGHEDHARIKVDAAGTWTSLGELMFRLEQRRDLGEEAALNALFDREAELLKEHQIQQAAEDAAKLREEASSGTPAE